MCKNNDIDFHYFEDIKRDPDVDYAEVTDYVEKSANDDFADFAGVSRDFVEALGQAIIDAYESHERNEEASIATSDIYSSEGGGKDDEDEDEEND